MPVIGAQGSAAHCQAAAKLASISARAASSVTGQAASASSRTSAASVILIVTVQLARTCDGPRSSAARSTASTRSDVVGTDGEAVALGGDDDPSVGQGVGRLDEHVDTMVATARGEIGAVAHRLGEIADELLERVGVNRAQIDPPSSMLLLMSTHQRSDLLVGGYRAAETLHARERVDIREMNRAQLLTIQAVRAAGLDLAAVVLTPWPICTIGDGAVEPGHDRGSGISRGRNASTPRPDGSTILAHP